MSLSNRIVNYFVFDGPNGSPLVHRAPVTVNALIAQELMVKQTGEKVGTPLHVCFDVDSGLIYIPNRYDHSYDKEKFEGFLQAAKFEVVRDFGDYKNQRPIDGSPFSSLRVRAVSSFPNMVNVIRNELGDKKYDDLVVIEANLSRMPSVVKNLPSVFSESKELIGAYVGKSHASSVSFRDEFDNKGTLRPEPIHLLTQETPFILLNVSPVSDPTVSDKEWGVLSGYRDYLEENKADELKDKISSSADLYAIKRYLTQGWPFEEVCLFLLEESVEDFSGLIESIKLLSSVARSLPDDGYANPASSPYYYSFKIDREDFPWDFSNIYNEDGEMDQKAFGSQPRDFYICDYDVGTSYIFLRSPVFISQGICERILKSKSGVAIYQYDRNTGDIESKGSLNPIPFSHYAGIRYLASRDNKVSFENTDLNDSGESYNVADPLRFRKRSVSEYFHACDFIKEMCDENEVGFDDFNVVIGPVEQLFGQGTQGGFMDKILFAKNGFKAPYEITKGLTISPPIIFMNSTSAPSYAEQAETLVHEYRHYIYSLKNPFYSSEYNEIDKSNQDEYWKSYLSDDNEFQAHKAQAKYALRSGKSVDEIIRDKVGGQITEGNYKIALYFSRIVDEASKELMEVQID